MFLTNNYGFLFNCDMLALALLRIEIFFLPSAFRQNLDKSHKFLSDSNNLADFKDVFLPKNSPPQKKDPHKKLLPKNSS